MAARKTADWPAPARPSPDQQRCLISTVRTELKLNPFGAALGVLSMGALILSGCGNGSNASTANEGSSTTTSGLSVRVDCGGKKTLKASGSTAQANAMTRFIKAFEQSCSGQTMNYTPNGSGAGISEFTSN